MGTVGQPEPAYPAGKTSFGEEDAVESSPSSSLQRLKFRLGLERLDDEDAVRLIESMAGQ